MSEIGEPIERTAPIQLLAIAFPGNRFKGEILPELDRLKRDGIVRILDMLIVRKDPAGKVLVAAASDLDWEEATAFGAYLGGLAGLEADGAEGFERGTLKVAIELADGHVFDEEDVFHVSESLGENTSAALLLIEHLWSKPLLDAVDAAGGIELFSHWVRPEKILSLTPPQWPDE